MAKKQKKQKQKLIPLTIDRAKWVRGNIGGDSALLNQKGNMCCLGFACRASGFAAKTIDQVGTPGGLTVYAKTKSAKRHRKIKLGNLVAVDSNGNVADSDETSHAVSVNDDGDLTEAEREQKLKPILKKLGFAAKFVGPKHTPESDE